MAWAFFKRRATTSCSEGGCENARILTQAGDDSMWSRILLPSRKNNCPA